MYLELLAKMKEFKTRERRPAHPIDVRKTQSRNCPGVQYPPHNAAVAWSITRNSSEATSMAKQHADHIIVSEPVPEA